MKNPITTLEQLNSALSQLRARQGDSTAIEVKSAQGGFPENLGATICAFANMPEGGTIILGVTEPSFEIVGVENPADYEARIANIARSAVVPSPTVAMRTITVGAKAVVIAHVYPLGLSFKPATFAGNPYLRQADGDYLMPANEQRMLEVAKLTRREEAAYELREVPGTSIDDLDPESTGQFIAEMRRAIRQISGESDERILATTSVLQNGKLTRAGLYGLGKFPQGAFPSLAVTVARRHDSSPANVRTSNLATFYGSVLDLFHQTMDWIRSNITYYQQYQDSGDQRSVPEIPLTAIREAVANAIIHRDLGPDTVEAGKSIDVRLHPDRLVISSPGGLKAVTVSQLYSEELTRVEVNQHLYRIARTLTDAEGNKLIEGEGGGVQTMIHEMLRAGLPKPVIVDTGVKVTVIFHRIPPEHRVKPPAPGATNSHESPTPRVPPAQMPSEGTHSAVTPARAQPISAAHVTKNGELVMDAIAAHGGSATLRQIMNAAGLTAQQVRYALNALHDAHLVRRSGGQGIRNTVYLTNAPA